MTHQADQNLTIEQEISKCENNNAETSTEIFIRGGAATFSTVATLVTGELIMPGIVAVHAGPVIIGVAIGGIALTKAVAYFSSEDCQKIADRMNEVAAQQQETAQNQNR